MRLLMVNKFYYLRGGTERYSFDLTRLLKANGHTVVPFAMVHGQNIPSPYASFFVPEISLDRSADLRRPWAVVAAAARAIYSREAQHRLAALVRQERPDVAYLHNIHHQFSLSILPLLREHGVPILWRLHDYALFCPNSTFYTQGGVCEACAGGHFYHAARRACRRGSRGASLVACLASYVDRLLHLAGHTGLFVAPSHFLADKMAVCGLDRERLAVQPNFLDLAAFDRDLAAACGNGVGRRPDGPLLFFGRLVPEKGADTLIAAVGRVPAARLLIAGDGPERARLEALAAAGAPGRVSFLGHQSPGALLAILAGASAVVVPSLWYENCPYTILEAFAARQAVVASRIGGIPELIQDGEDGLLFQPGDVAGLADRIGALLASGQYGEHLGKRARQKLEAGYDAAGHYAGFLELCARLPAPHRLYDPPRAVEPPPPPVPPPP
jgi:glycosyltransferase involved in cell wall biosynthesis